LEATAGGAVWAAVAKNEIFQKKKSSMVWKMEAIHLAFAKKYA